MPCSNEFATTSKKQSRSRKEFALVLALFTLKRFKEHQFFIQPNDPVRYRGANSDNSGPFWAISPITNPRLSTHL